MAEFRIASSSGVISIDSLALGTRPIYHATVIAPINRVPPRRWAA